MGIAAENLPTRLRFSPVPFFGIQILSFVYNFSISSYFFYLSYDDDYFSSLKIAGMIEPTSRDFAAVNQSNAKEKTMSANRENLENPGIFVRILNDDIFFVTWTDGRGVMELAQTEERCVEDESITGFLRKSAHVDDIERDTYDQWGTYTSTVVLRSITLREAVHYLGRNAKICAFLRPKAQAVRFMNALEKGGSLAEVKVAAEIRALLPRFEAVDEVILAEKLAEYLEEQLLNITSGSFEP